MNKFDKIISEYITEEDPGMAPAPAPVAPVNPAAAGDATQPQPVEEPQNLTPEGRIQMLDMIRKALLISPTDLKQDEKMELGMSITHGNVEEKKAIMDKVFNRIEATGTADLGHEEPREDF